MSSLASAPSQEVAVTGVVETLRRRPGVALPMAATLLLMTAGSAVILAVAVLTLFRARRLYHEALARGLARTILWLWGIRIAIHRDAPWPRRQTVYISNHTSTLDLFILVGLGLPNTRFFLSGALRKIVPLGVIATVMGTFFTVLQTDPVGRVRVFQRADRILRRTGESVYLSPEGKRVTTGRIGHFNKGAFHLATSLRAPIVPFYIHIPPEVDPGRGIDARPGIVQVYVLPPIRTDDWCLEDLEANRDRVCELFLSFEQALRAA